jgi:protein-tyrosine-phosphatase
MPPRTIPLALASAERLRKLKAIAKRLLPDRLVKELSTYRAYPKKDRLLYLRVRISSSLKLPKPKLFSPGRAQLFVFVCFGNIMRSPMCEALMNRECAAFGDSAVRVTSAGLHAVPGREAHPMAIAAARELGISLSEHRARPLSPELVAQATVIFTMDFQNQVEVLSRYPEVQGKTFLLSAFAGADHRSAEYRSAKYRSADHRSAEIADPYYLGEEGTRQCYRTLAACIRNLAREVSEGTNPAV